MTVEKSVIILHLPGSEQPIVNWPIIFGLSTDFPGNLVHSLCHLSIAEKRDATNFLLQGFFRCASLFHPETSCNTQLPLLSRFVYLALSAQEGKVVVVVCTHTELLSPVFPCFCFTGAVGSIGTLFLFLNILSVSRAPPFYCGYR